MNKSSQQQPKFIMNKTLTVTEAEVLQWHLNMPDEMIDAISSRFKLLSEPMRLKILRTLCDQEHTVQEIVNDINASQANISKHLALMYESGIVSRRKEGLKCYYRIADESVIYSCYLSSKGVVENLKQRLSQAQKTHSTPITF